MLIADDSAGVRLAIAAGLRRLPNVEVVGTAVDGVDVVGKALQLRPDLVTLDIEMPHRDGVSAAAAIHRHSPNTILAIVSGMGPRAVETALAVAPGLPVEYIPKPGGGQEFEEWVASRLTPLIDRLAARFTTRSTPAPAARAEVPAGNGIHAVLVGASTGGPAAVTAFLSSLDPNIGVPVIIVQHMPAMFTDVFARNLDHNTPWRTREAYDGAPVRRGEAWVAQVDRHFCLEWTGQLLTLRLNDGPREHGCRPSVDVLFRSAAETLGSRCVAVMLTGMGRDGTPAASVLHAKGVRLVAQDEATSVVWGMPGALVQAGLADAVLPLPEIAAWVTTEVRNAQVKRRSPL